MTDIKLITIAYSPRWCHYVKPEKIAEELFKRINARLIDIESLPWKAYHSIVQWADGLKQGVCELREALPDTADFLKSCRGNATQI